MNRRNFIPFLAGLFSLPFLPKSLLKPSNIEVRSGEDALVIEIDELLISDTETVVKGVKTNKVYEVVIEVSQQTIPVHKL